MSPAERALERGDRGLVLTILEPVIRASCQDLFVPGADREDVLQEARMSVLRALPLWREGGGATLVSYARLAARRGALTALKTEQRGKRAVLNDAVSLDADPENPLDPPAVGTPSEVVEARETLRETAQRLRTCSLAERDAVLGIAEGYSYEEIQERTGLDKKSIDNAAQRARKKLQGPLPEAVPERAPSPKPRRALPPRGPGGVTREDAERYLGVPVVPGVRKPDGRAIPERRARPRRGDRAVMLWLPEEGPGPPPLPVRFPQGARVRGPFRIESGTYAEGEGLVDWALDVSRPFVPVDVTAGDRFSGGYDPEELEIIAA